MKKILIRILVVLNGVLLLPVPVLGEGIEPPVSSAWKDLPAILNQLTSWIRPLSIMLLLWMLVWGGFTKLRAAGNPDEEKKAMAIIRSAIIGFVIIAVAPLIIETIGLILGIELLSPSP